MKKRIIISLSVITLVGAAVIGGTYAFFSDEEASTGNVFTAGAIDLKVDHSLATYNGNPCTKDCVEVTGTNLIQNGSFEVPEVTDPAKWEIFANGTSGLGWTVEWAGAQTSFGGSSRPEPALVEYHEGVLGNAQEGDQYTELDSDWFGPNNPLDGEPALVKIHQDIPTTPGEKYKLHYYFSPRPNTGSTENTMYVNIDGLLVDTRGPVAGGTSIVWTEYTKEFTATNATTKVEFVGGGTDNSLGVFLDDVSVHPMNCTYQITGGTCTLWPEKDLTQGDRFWNFGDVKPGDHGTNVISLHVYSNDAYVCMLTDKVVDNENTLTQPEIAASDLGPANQPNGELSKYIHLSAWNDLNGNGVYEPGSEGPLLAGPDAPFNPEMLQLTLASAQSMNVGLAWCVGTQTVDGSGNFSCDGSGNQNDAQTDSTVADMVFYAVQQRNNAGFSCADYVK